jgi:hypothetical protein
MDPDDYYPPGYCGSDCGECNIPCSFHRNDLDELAWRVDHIGEQILLEERIESALAGVDPQLAADVLDAIGLRLRAIAGDE